VAAQEIAPGSGTWTAPACTTVSGTAGVTFTTDEGATLTPTAQTLTGTSYTEGVVALDTPNTLLATVGSVLYRSTDAGCRWTPAANLGRSSGNALLTLTAASGDRAYVWSLNGSPLYRADGRTVTALKSPVTSVMGLGVDPANHDRLKLVDSNGQVWQSADAGATWSTLGRAPVSGAFAYRAAFDPHSVDHIVVGTMVSGAFVTTDGGVTWTQSTGTSSTGGNSNIFNAVISPVNASVVWAEGIDLAESANNVPSEGRHIFRSVDGGFTFTPVVEQNADVTLVNGPTMAAHPTDANVLYFTFGMSFGGYGTDLYRFDATTSQITKTHNAYHGIHAFAFNPAAPSVTYLGLVHEQVQ
jgi:photosystem II stability/assembly factor-like uncharacterized protein